MRNRLKRFSFYIRLALCVLIEAEHLEDESRSLYESVVENELLNCAKRRVNRSKKLKPYYDYLLGTRWTVWIDHLEWVAFGDESEILKWCK